MGVPNRGFGPSRARACVYRYLYLLIMGVPKPQIGGFQIAMILMGSLKWPLLGPKYGPFGPFWGHPIPFWSLSGPLMAPHILYPIEEGCQDGC